MSKLSLAAFAALAATVAVPVLAQGASTPDYLEKAGAGDLFEKRASEAVLQTTANPAIRALAQEMIVDHARSTQMVTAAALRAGLHPAAPSLAPRQLRMLADLKSAKGARRDAIYVSQLKVAHGDALKVQQDYALTGDVPPLKAAAAKIVPVVQHHIAMLDRLPAM